MKVRANQVGTYPSGHRRKPGEEFEIPDNFRLPLWCDPVDPSVQRPPPKRPGVLIGRPPGNLRAEARAQTGVTMPNTLHAIAHGETPMLKKQLVEANERAAKAEAFVGDLLAKLDALSKRLDTLSTVPPSEPLSAGPPSEPLSAGEFTP